MSRVYTSQKRDAPADIRRIAEEKILEADNAYLLHKSESKRYRNQRDYWRRRLEMIDNGQMEMDV